MRLRVVWSEEEVGVAALRRWRWCSSLVGRLQEEEEEEEKEEEVGVVAVQMRLLGGCHALGRGGVGKWWGELSSRRKKPNKDSVSVHQAPSQRFFARHQRIKRQQTGADGSISQHASAVRQRVMARSQRIKRMRAQTRTKGTCV